MSFRSSNSSCEKMGEEAKEVHDQSSREIEQITAQTNGCPRDLLKRFKAGSNHHLFRHHSTRSSELVGAGATGEDDDEEIGLNLGLSLGGCFGVNPRENTNNNNNNNSSLRRSSSTNIKININNNNNNNNYDNSNNRLVRSSSSIAGLTTLVRDEESVVGQQQQQQQAAALCSSLIRTSSLPMETEEEWRKRKELQTLRRMEAKRKRSEKQQQKNMNMIRTCGGVKDGKDRASLERSCEEDKRVVEVVVEDHHRSTSSKQQQQQQGVVGAAFGLSSWAAALVRGMDASSLNNGTKVNNVVVDGVGSQPQGSLGSQGSTSSGISESLQGISNCTESRSPSSVQSLPEQQIEQKPIIVLPRPMPEKSSTPLRTEGENHAKKKPKLVDQNGVVEETGMKVMEEMPCVSTKGDGPNGKRIEGFLYKYRKGEEVRIVCVCHGNFLSPAEFVKHAGGGDVAHPLRHIVVNPSPSFLS